MSEIKDLKEDVTSENADVQAAEPKKKQWKLLKRKIEPSDWVNFAAIVVIVGLLAWAAAAYMKYFGRFNTGDVLESAEQLKNYLAAAYPRAGLVVMTLLQAFQVVLSVIPAAMISFASGMIYGLGWSLVIGTIGSAIGTTISFYLSRLLGRKVVTLFVKEKTMLKLEGMLSGDMSMIVLVVLFILPTPKDFFPYFLGLTNIKAWKVFVIAALGRLPGMFVTCYMGSTILNRNYVLLALSVVFMSVVMILFVVFRDKIIAALKKDKPSEAA